VNGLVPTRLPLKVPVHSAYALLLFGQSGGSPGGIKSPQLPVDFGTMLKEVMILLMSADCLG